MIKAGLTQSALAKKVGVSQSAVYRWLSGQDSPTPKRLGVIAAALNTTITELLGETASLESKFNLMVKEKLQNYTSGIEILPPGTIPQYETRSLPYYEVPARGKENFLVEEMEGFMEADWTSKGDLIVKVNGSSLEVLGFAHGTEIAIRLLKGKRDIEAGKVVLIKTKTAGEYLTTLAKYDKSLNKKNIEIIGIAVDMHRNL